MVYNQNTSNQQAAESTAFSILVCAGLSHFMNDMIQSVIPSIYPIIKDSYGFSFAQIGIITLFFQMMSSILQPFTGFYADRHPRPYALAIGMCFTLAGLLSLAFAGTFTLIILSVSLIGLGSSVFHPEASRVAQMASGGKKSLAQSIFQVGGNGGNALGPILAALVVQPFGQRSIGWFSIVAVIAILTMLHIGSWYKRRLLNATLHKKATPQPFIHLSHRRVHWVLAILVVLIFSKYFYLSCMTSYFTFFLIDKFHISVQASQFCLFAFLGASAIGTLGGGLLGDRFGRKYVGWTIALAVVVGLVISSAFSSIVVYATDLMPDKIGMISGVFFGLMFGLGGVGSAFFGWLADRTSVEYIFLVSSFSPLLGIVAGLLPNTQKKAVSQQ